jgi:hypothetical protein
LSPDVDKLLIPLGNFFQALILLLQGHEQGVKMRSIRTLITAAVLSAAAPTFAAGPGEDAAPPAGAKAVIIEEEGAVPEPLSVGLMGIGLLGLGVARRRLR